MRPCRQPTHAQEEDQDGEHDETVFRDCIHSDYMYNCTHEYRVRYKLYRYWSIQHTHKHTQARSAPSGRVTPCPWLCTRARRCEDDDAEASIEGIELWPGSLVGSPSASERHPDSHGPDCGLQRWLALRIGRRRCTPQRRRCLSQLGMYGRTHLAPLAHPMPHHAQCVEAHAPPAAARRHVGA